MQPHQTTAAASSHSPPVCSRTVQTQFCMFCHMQAQQVTKLLNISLASARSGTLQTFDVILWLPMCLAGRPVKPARRSVPYLAAAAAAAFKSSSSSSCLSTARPSSKLLSSTLVTAAVPCDSCNPQHQQKQQRQSNHHHGGCSSRLHGQTRRSRQDLERP
jgi:hypothetical protein